MGEPGVGIDAFGGSDGRIPAATIAAERVADELRIPAVEGLVCDVTPAYAWDPRDREPWAPAPRRLVRAVRRALPPPPSAGFDRGHDGGC